MKILAVVFDFDGTLVDSNAIKRQGFFDVVAEEPDGPARMQSVLSNVQGDRRAIFDAYVAARGAAGPDASVLVQRYSARVDAGVASAPEIDGATALLRTLHDAGQRVFISSATPLANLAGIIEHRGWRRWCDSLYGHPSRKPDTLRRIRDELGLDTRAMAVVGDGADDHDSAKSLGCSFFPVGEARGVPAGTRVFTLPEVADHLLSSHATSHRVA